MAEKSLEEKFKELCKIIQSLPADGNYLVKY